jgi:peptide/nickel transport system permease protein
MQDGAATTAGPAAAAPLPDILPPVRKRSGMAGFVYRHPTMAIGGIMLLILLFIAVFAPSRRRRSQCDCAGQA